jgi:ABC-type branched-subunit amino acid transport system substrate-binding protein
MLRKFLILITLSLFVEHAIAVRIAVLMNLNDSYAKYPQDMLIAMKFALKQSKLNKDIILNEFSHSGDPESIQKAVLAAKKFDPDIVIAGETSQYAMTISRAFKEKIFITPTASSQLLNETHPHPVRMIHSDDQHLAIIEELDSKKMLGRVGILHNKSFPNTNRISTTIRKFFDANKRTYSVIEVLNGEEITEKKLHSFIHQKIESLIIFSYDTDLRKVFTILKEKNIYPIYVGSDGWGRDSFLKENLLKPGSKFKGVRSLYWDTKRKDKNFRNIVRAMESSLAMPIDAFHAIGYDTMSVILDILQKDIKIENFYKNLTKMTFKNVITSREIRFNSELFTLKDMYIYKLDEKGISPYFEVKPK